MGQEIVRVFFFLWLCQPALGFYAQAFPHWPSCDFNALLRAYDGETKILSCVTEMTRAELPEYQAMSAEETILVDLHNVTGCQAQDFETPPFPIANNTVALARGNCSVLKKALSVQARHGAALLVVDFKENSTKPFYMYDVNDLANRDLASILEDADSNLDSNVMTKPNVSSDFEIPVAMISYEKFAKIEQLNTSKGVNVTLYGSPEISLLFTYGAASLVLISIITTVFSALWGAWRDEGKITLGLEAVASPDSKPDSDVIVDEQLAVFNDCISETSLSRRAVGFKGLVIMFALLVTGAVLVNCVYYVMVYVLLVLFATLSAFSLCFVARHSLDLMTSGCICCCHCCLDVLNICGARIRVSTLYLITPSVITVSLWLYNRHTWWVAQDLFLVAICLTTARLFRLASLKVLLLLTVLNFVYEAALSCTTSGPQPAADYIPGLADGGAPDLPVRKPATAEERLPWLFIVPIFNDGFVENCVSYPFASISCLGTVIQGLLMSYVMSYDLLLKTHLSYTGAGVLGYVLGLGPGLIFLIGTGRLGLGLLFTLPSMLGSILFVAWLRREVPVLWRGCHLTHQPLAGTYREIGRRVLDPRHCDRIFGATRSPRDTETTRLADGSGSPRVTESTRLENGNRSINGRRFRREHY